jgi:hypothetical protein
LIYNNIFIDSGGGNGVITGTSNGCLRNVSVYNNTFVRNAGGPWLATGTGTQTGNVAQNNLLYDMSGAHTATADYSYNGYFTCTSVPADANSIDSATDPFVSVATDNFRLAAGALAILAGINLSAYFTTDIVGSLRSPSGPWDIGAYAYTVYAFKRLGPDTLAPYRANWGLDNRSAMIRIPPERGSGTRLEVRVADGAANPYLMTAAILAAGLDGILNKLEAPEPVVGMSYENESAPVLPMSLEEALDALQKDTVLREILQGPIVDIFDVLKRDEVRRYKEAVSDPNTRETTDWEVKEYMSDF